MLGVRLAGLADADRVAAATGMSEDSVRSELDSAVASGLARRREGRAAGWLLSVEGRLEVERLVAAQLSAEGVGDEVSRLYRDFLTVNGELLVTCTAWQVHDRSQQLNDHTDSVYDETVIGRLIAVDAVIQPVCVDLAAALDRFGGYGLRLGSALAAVQSGDHDWFTSPRVDSYHSAWFELHEDLLVTLGLERADETAAV